MSEFITIAKVGQIPEGRGRKFAVGDREIAVFQAGGRYYALDDFCPHLGASLGASELHDGHVICNRHDWGFRLTDGVCREAPTLKAQTFEIRVAGEEIQVSLPAGPDSRPGE